MQDGRNCAEAGISTDNLKKIILRQIALIDRDSMVDDLKNWPLWGNNTVRVDISHDGRWTVSYVINWFKGRVAWMDQEWGYPQEKDQLR